MALRFLPTLLLAACAASTAFAFVPGEVVRTTKSEALQYQGLDFLSASKGQEFPVIQHDAARRLVFVPFYKPDGTAVALSLPADAVEAAPHDGWNDLLAGCEAFRDGRGDVARQFVARAAEDEKYKALAAALAPRLQGALASRSVPSLTVLRETASQLEKLGYPSLALAVDEGTDKLGGATAPASKLNREDLKKRVAISTRAVGRARQAVAFRCLVNADQEIKTGLEAEPARPELKALQPRVQKDLQEARDKAADADRMRRFTKGGPHAVTALDMGLKLCTDLPELAAMKKELGSAFEERTAPPVNAAFLKVAGGGDEKALAEGHGLYTNRCTQCHELELLDSRTVSGWQRAIAGMARRAGLNDAQQTRIVEYITSAQKVAQSLPE